MLYIFCSALNVVKFKKEDGFLLNDTKGEDLIIMNQKNYVLHS